MKNINLNSVDFLLFRGILGLDSNWLTIETNYKDYNFLKDKEDRCFLFNLSAEIYNDGFHTLKSDEIGAIKTALEEYEE